MSKYTPEEIWTRRNKFLNEFLEENKEPKTVDHKAEWAKLSAAAAKRGTPVTIRELYPVFGVNELKKISQGFYDGVYSDTATWFSEQFTVSKKEEAIINQWTFFMEHMGGPKAFEEWRNPGGEKLVQFTHEKFRMTQGGMVRWMMHMNKAVADSAMPAACPEATRLFLEWCESFGKRMIVQPGGEAQRPSGY